MFRIRNIYKVLESIPDNNDAILIRGQALNIRAEHNAQQDPSLYTQSPFFSHDIDFLGDTDTAAAMHNIQKGELRVPDMDTHTPMPANLKFHLEDGRPVNIDFLKVITGVDNYRIRRDALRASNPDTQECVLVLHPAHCLAGRIYNTYSILSRRSWEPDSRNADRTKLAVKVLNHALRTKTRTGGHIGLLTTRPALRLKTRQNALIMQDNIDVLEAIPTNPELGMSEDFLNERYPRIRHHVAHRRELYSRNFEKLERSEASTPDDQSFDIEPGE